MVRAPDLFAPRAGRSCLQCRKWTNGACADPRRTNDDPSRPCLLYRYREQLPAGSNGQEAGAKYCPACRKLKPEGEFFSGSNKIETRTCQRCRDKRKAAYWRRKKEETE